MVDVVVAFIQSMNNLFIIVFFSNIKQDPCACNYPYLINSFAMTL